MNKINNGGSAFPVIAENGLGHISEGMTLRDWFAGQALQRFAHGLGVLSEDGEKYECERYAKCAYFMADAMIAERGRLGYEIQKETSCD